MRIAIISDIHEDLISLQKAIKEIDEQAVNKIVCLGDIVGFENDYYKFDKTRSAKKCLHLVEEKADIVITGNHELESSKKMPIFKDIIGFPTNWYFMSMKEKEEVFSNKFFLYKNEAENDLCKEDVDRINKLKSWDFITINDYKILFTHFIYPDVNGNLNSFKNSKDRFSGHINWMKDLNSNLSFVGHAHISGLGIFGKKGLKVKGFGKYKHKDNAQIIFCPPIVNGKNKNGFVIFDYEDSSIEVIKL